MSYQPPAVMDSLVAVPEDQKRTVRVQTGQRVLSHDAETFKRNFQRIVGLPCKLDPTPEQIASGHIGRNDKCLCGSGNKFKKCCFLRKS